MFDWRVNHDIVKLLDIRRDKYSGPLTLRVERNKFW